MILSFLHPYDLFVNIQSTQQPTEHNKEQKKVNYEHIVKKGVSWKLLINRSQSN